MTNNAIRRAIQSKIDELFVYSHRINVRLSSRQLLRGPPHRHLLGKDAVTQEKS